MTQSSTVIITSYLSLFHNFPALTSWIKSKSSSFRRMTQVIGTPKLSCPDFDDLRKRTKFTELYDDAVVCTDLDKFVVEWRWKTAMEWIRLLCDAKLLSVEKQLQAKQRWHRCFSVRERCFRKTINWWVRMKESSNSSLSTSRCKLTSFFALVHQTAGVEVCVAKVAVPDTTTTVELYLSDTGGNEVFFEDAKKNVRNKACLKFYTYSY